MKKEKEDRSMCKYIYIPVLDCVCVRERVKEKVQDKRMKGQKDRDRE